MKVALGFKSHSGWAALIALGASDGTFQVVDRRRIELIDEGELWAKQPYHSAEELETDEANAVVKLGIESARRVAVRQMREAVKRVRESGSEVAVCCVLMPSPMPQWSTAEILAVHFRMHKAEGVLFPDALCRAAGACKLPLVTVAEKQLEDFAEATLGVPFTRSMEIIADLGKTVGPPWGKDQKTATLAAMIGLR